MILAGIANTGKHRLNIHASEKLANTSNSFLIFVDLMNNTSRAFSEPVTFVSHIQSSKKQLRGEHANLERR